MDNHDVKTKSPKLSLDLDKILNRNKSSNKFELEDDIMNGNILLHPQDRKRLLAQSGQSPSNLDTPGGTTTVRSK